MTKSTRAALTIIGTVFLLLLACTCGGVSSLGQTPPPEVTVAVATEDGNGEEPTPESDEPTQEVIETATAISDGGGNFDTEFPIPDDAQTFTNVGGNVNFQTGMSLEDTLAFYRDAFTSQGYTEREILTSVTDGVFSIVFDGHPSGDAIVVQAVDLGNNTTNVNIRFEDV